MNHEHQPTPNDEPNWESGEFGPYGYRFPLIAEVFAIEWAATQAAIERGDDQFEHPFDLPDVGTVLLDDIEPQHVDAAVRALARSRRDSDRSLAGEILAAKQMQFQYYLDPSYTRWKSPTPLVVDPVAEVQLWRMLVEHENSPLVLQDQWTWLQDYHQEMIHPPESLQKSDFDEPLQRLYDRFQELLGLSSG